MSGIGKYTVRLTAALIVTSSLQIYAAQARDLTVMVGGGAYGDAQIEAYVKPFEAETGLKVNAVKDQLQFPRLKLMVENNNIDVDVFSMAQADAISAARAGYLEDIDYSIYKAEELEGIDEKIRRPWGVPSLYYGYIMGLNKEQFPDGEPRPENWADFWDTGKFQGVRTLQSGEYGAEGPWEEALLADGVPMDQIYPMDIDRVFASLDKIKSDIRVWWRVGSEVQQLFHDKSVDVGMAYDGRLTLLEKEGSPVALNYVQGKATWDPWSITKGSPNAEAAQKFIEFATRAKPQAKFAELSGYGPTNLNAFDYIDPKIAPTLTSYPEHLKDMLIMNVDWYSEVGSDGKTNTQRLIDRWNAWILQ